MLSWLLKATTGSSGGRRNGFRVTDAKTMFVGEPGCLGLEYLGIFNWGLSWLASSSGAQLGGGCAFLQGSCVIERIYWMLRPSLGGFPKRIMLDRW